MRKWSWAWVPMTALLLSGCGEKSADAAAELRGQYRDMAGCTMEAAVSYRQDDQFWDAVLRCEDVPAGETTVEVLEPDSIAGIRAVLRDTDWDLVYDDAVLNAGTRNAAQLSPAECLPRLVSALRDGWLVEENRETWADIPCLRLSLDQTGENGEKLLSTVWLKEADGTPVRGEIAADGEIILTAEFTSFAFYDKITDDSGGTSAES